MQLWSQAVQTRWSYYVAVFNRKARGVNGKECGSFEIKLNMFGFQKNNNLNCCLKKKLSFNFSTCSYLLRREHLSHMCAFPLTAAIDAIHDKRRKEWNRGIVGAEWACQASDLWRDRCRGLGVWGKLAGRALRIKNTETQKRSRHASYVMIIRKHRAPSVLHPARLWGTGLGLRSRCAGWGNTGKGLGGRNRDADRHENGN